MLAEQERIMEPLIVDLSENAVLYDKCDTESFDQAKTECLVCFEAFEQGCKVIRMPCNPTKHFFHLKCIESWIGTH